MTNKICSIRKLEGHRICYEISTGIGIGGKQIFGVTFVEFSESGTRRIHNLSQCCHSMCEVKSLISKTKAELMRGDINIVAGDFTAWK